MVNTPFTNLHEPYAILSSDLFTFAEQLINFQVIKYYPKQNKNTMSCEKEGGFYYNLFQTFSLFEYLIY